MDTDLLKTFLEVSKTRHFGKAADNLFVTQAAVSARIKTLEKMLGASLLVRSRNNIHLFNYSMIVAQIHDRWNPFSFEASFCSC